MKADLFKAWLVTDYRSASDKPMTKKASEDCASRVARVERRLHLDVDGVELSAEGFEGVIDEWRIAAAQRGLAPAATGDCVAALLRYCEFRGSLQ